MGTGFQHLKAWICHTLLNPTLMYYTRTRPVIVQTDASEYSLGTTPIQSGQPTTFASKTLTDVETHYTNIKRECLSVCFSLKKFHTYLYNRQIIVQNDHKCLEMPPFLACSASYSTCKSMTIQSSTNLTR